MLSYSIQEICRKVKGLVRKYGTSDPERLCMECGINLIYDDMGTEDTSIKAMMIVYRRIKNIVVNENLPDIIMTFILAHELGHAVLHASRCKQFTDYGLFDNSGVMEKEANIFAAELLLGDSDDLYHEMRYSELTLFQIAAAHNVPYELLAYKLEIMEEEGYDVPELPYEPDSSFLSGYLGDYDSDWL